MTETSHRTEDDLDEGDAGREKPALAGSYLITLAGSVGMIVLTLFTGVVSARLLSTDGRGAVGAIAGWALVVTVVSSFGFREGLSWVQAKTDARSRDVLAVGLASIAVTSAIGIAAAELLIPIGFSAQSDEVIREARIFMLWVVPYTACYTFTALFAARQRFVPVTLMRVGQPFLYAVGLIVVWVTDSATVRSVLTVQVLSFTVLAVVAFLALRSESGLGRVDRALARSSFSFGSRAFGSTLGQLANARLDMLVLPAVVASTEIGLYVVAVSAGGMIVGVFGSLHHVVFPAAARRGGDDAVAVSQRAMRVVFVASVAAALVLAVLAGFLVRFLYGNDFAGAVEPLRLLLPGVVCLATAQIATGALKGIGHPSGASIAQFAGVLVTVVGLVVLLGPYGISGAAITSSASYAVTLIVAIMLFTRASGTRVRDIFSLRDTVSDVRWSIARLRDRNRDENGESMTRIDESAGATDEARAELVGARTEEASGPAIVDAPSSHASPSHASPSPASPSSSLRSASDSDVGSARRSRVGVGVGRRTPASGDTAWSGDMFNRSVGLAATVLGGLGAAYVVSGEGLGDIRALALILAGPFAAALFTLAVMRFEWFVLTVLAIRPSVDILGVGALGPGAMLALVFLSASSLWLVVQWRAGEWRPMSLASKCLLGFAGATGAAVMTSQMRVVSAEAALEILAGIAMFIVLEQLIAGRPDRLRRLVVTVLASGVVPVLVAMSQLATGGGMSGGPDLSGVTRIQGTFVHPNPFAGFVVLLMLLTITIIPLVTRRVQFGLAAYLVILGVTLVVTYHRSGWIAFIVGVAYIGLRRSKLLLGVLVAALAIIAVTVPSVSQRITDLSAERERLPEGVPNDSLEWRFQYWERLIPLGADSPVTGIGPQVVLNSRPEGVEPHNVYVQVFVELGLAGVVALGAVIVGFGVTLSRRRRNAPDVDHQILAVGAIACALAVFAQSPSENLLNATMTWWYLAACATWGGWRLPREGPPPEAAAIDGRTPEFTRSVAG